MVLIYFFSHILKLCKIRIIISNSDEKTEDHTDYVCSPLLVGRLNTGLSYSVTSAFSSKCVTTEESPYSVLIT